MRLLRSKIILPNDPSRFVEIPEKAEQREEKKLTPYEQHQENYRKTRERAARYDAPYTYPQEDNNKAALVPLLLIFLVVGIVIFISASSKSCLSRPLDVSEKKPLKTSTPPKIEDPAPTPFPQINY